jgi:ribosomal-protein-alanine N-acetyltransferase
MSPQSKTAIVIRPMTAEDIDQAIEIAASQPNAPSYSREFYLTTIENSAPQKRVSFVAKNDQNGSILGFIIASFVAPEAELETLVSAPKHQRQGIARQLVTALIHELRSAGNTSIHLEVRPSNQPAINLYKSIGFTQFSTRKSYYSNPPDDAIVLTIKI